MVQHENESNWHFWTRGTCSGSCANRSRTSPELRYEAAKGRHCPFCGAEITRNYGENICKFEARQTCGGLACVNQCRSVNQWGDRPVEPGSKRCPICNVAFFRREGERRQNWRKRLTCCAAHSYQLQGQSRKEHFEKDPPVTLDDMLVNYGNGFAAHNIPFKPSGYYRTPGPAINRTLGGVSG